jgi:hypothetical protein
MCLKSKAFGGEAGVSRAEQEWAYREAGEGVEELWEAAVSSSRRWATTHTDERFSGESLEDTLVL